MTRTTRRRLLILTTATALIGGGTAGAYFFRQAQTERRFSSERDAGMELFRAGNYSQALEHLAKYIGRHQDNAEVLFAYGKSRALTEEVDQRNVVEGIQILRRYATLKRDDPDAQHLLLELYTRAAYNSEAVALSGEILKGNPKDAPALKARYVALGRQRKYDDALTTLQAYLDLKPTDLSAHWDVFTLLDARQSPRADGMTHAQAFAKRIGENDPRALLLIAQAKTFLNDAPGATESLRAATAAAKAGGTSGFAIDADFVSRAADMYDRLQLFSEGQQLVESAADANATDPELASTLAMRLWTSGRYDAVVRRTDALSLTDRQSSTALLAMRAMSLWQLDKKDQATEVISALASRKEDPLAAAWALALRTAYLTPDATPITRRKNYETAILRAAPPRDSARATAEAVFCHLLAGVNNDLVERDVAIANWETAIQRLPQWPLPYQLCARAQLQMDRPAEAHEIARRLYVRQPNVDNLLLLADAWSRHLLVQRGSLSAAALLEELTNAQKTYPTEPRLIPAIALARGLSGDLQGASQIVRAAADDPNTPAPVLLRLDEVTRLASLGLDNITGAALARRGIASASPEDGLSRALQQSATGDTAGAFEKLKASAGDKPSVGWQIAICRFADETASAETALKAWQSLAAAAPTDLNANLALLSSRAAWDDRALVKGAIDHVKEIAGDSGITWRIAQARLLLSVPKGQAVGDSESAEAIGLLRDVIRAAPRLVAPRWLMAKALKNINAAGSLEQYSEAANLDPQSPGIAIDLINLLIDQGKLSDAKLAAQNIASTSKSGRLSPGQRIKIARLLSDLDDNQSAVALLGTVSTARATNAADDDLLQRDIVQARLLARQGPAKEQEARALYQTLLTAPKPDPKVFADAAEFYATAHDIDLARRTFDRGLEDAKPVVANTARANFEIQFGDLARASALLREVVAASPSNIPAHIQLVSLLLRTEKYDDARTAIEAAQKVDPANVSLMVLSDACIAIQRMPNRGDLGRLLSELVTHDPSHPAMADTLKALAVGKYAISDPATLEGLIKVTQKYRDYLPAYVLLIEGELGARQPELATTFANNCFAQLSDDPAAAKLAVATNLAAHRPDTVVGIATRWRQLTPDNPIPADQALATAYLALNDPVSALRQLDRALKVEKRDAQTQLLYCRALLASGKTTQAWDAASQLWKNPKLRSPLIAALTESTGDSQTVALLDRFSRELADSELDRFILARGFYQIGSKAGSEEALNRADALFKAMSASGKMPPLALMIWADVSSQRGDNALAEQQLRTALAETPNGSGVIANNLAALLLKKKDPAAIREAAELARNAVAGEPAKSEFHDTLAHAQYLLGQTDASLASYRRALDLAPNQIESLAGLGTVLVKTGKSKSKEAVDILERIDTLTAGKELPVTLQDQLKDLRGAIKQ